MGCGERLAFLRASVRLLCTGGGAGTNAPGSTSTHRLSSPLAWCQQQSVQRWSTGFRESISCRRRLVFRIIAEVKRVCRPGVYAYAHTGLHTIRDDGVLLFGHIPVAVFAQLDAGVQQARHVLGALPLGVALPVASHLPYPICRYPAQGVPLAELLQRLNELNRSILREPVQWPVIGFVG